MKLTTTCYACKKEIILKSNASTRPELVMEKGETFSVKCSDCKKNQTRHVNDISAKENYINLLGGIGIGALVTIVLWKFLGAIGTVSFLIPILIWKQESNAAHAFNSYRIRR